MAKNRDVFPNPAPASDDVELSHSQTSGEEDQPKQPTDLDNAAQRLRNLTAVAYEKRSVERQQEQATWDELAKMADGGENNEGGENGAEAAAESQRKWWQPIKDVKDAITMKSARDERKVLLRKGDALAQAFGLAAEKKQRLFGKGSEEASAKEVQGFKDMMQTEMERVREANKLATDEFSSTSEGNALLQGERVQKSSLGKEQVLSKGETLEKADDAVTKEIQQALVRYVGERKKHLKAGKDEKAIREDLEYKLKKDMVEWRQQLAKGDELVQIDEKELLELVDELAGAFDGAGNAEEAGDKELEKFIEENLQLTVGRNIQMGEVQSNIDRRTGALGSMAQKVLGTFNIPSGMNGKGAMALALAGPGGARMAVRFGVGAIAGATLGIPAGLAVGAAAGIATGVGFGLQRGRRSAEKEMMRNGIETGEGKGYRNIHSMAELTTALERHIEKGENVDRDKALATLTHVMAARQLYEREGYAVLPASKDGEFTAERHNLYVQMGRLEAMLRGDKDAKEFHAELTSKLTDEYMKGAKERFGIAGENGVDQIVHSKRAQYGRKGALSSAVTSLVAMGLGSVAGHAASEAVTEFLQNDQGPAGDLWRSLMERGVNAEAVNSGAVDLSAEADAITSDVAEAKISPNMDGGYNILITDENGNDQLLTDDPIHYTADNRMWESDKDALQAKGFTVSEVPDEEHGNYVMSTEKTVMDYLAEGHENIEQISDRHWGTEVATTDWYVGEGDDTGYYMMRVADAPEGAEYAISLNKDMQTSVVTYPIENGYVKIPMDDPVTSTFTPTGRGHNLEFGAAYGEVMTVDESGVATVYHTDVGGEGATTLRVPQRVPAYKYVIEGNGQKVTIPSPETESHAAATMEAMASYEGMSQADVVNTSSGETGRLVVNTNIDVDPAGEAGVAEQYHFGNSTFNAEVSESEMASNTFSQMLANDAQKDLLADALGMEPGASKEAVAEELTRQFGGAELDVTDLTVTPNTMTTYQYDGHALPQFIDGKANGGHALEARRDGRWLLDSVRLRDFFGIPHDAAGHFALRLDCGGQIVWIPDQATPEIITPVTETVTTPPTSTPPTDTTPPDTTPPDDTPPTDITPPEEPPVETPPEEPPVETPPEEPPVEETPPPEETVVPKTENPGTGPNTNPNDTLTEAPDVPIDASDAANPAVGRANANDQAPARNEGGVENPGSAQQYGDMSDDDLANWARRPEEEK